MQTFDILVDRIYEAAINPDLWSPVLHDISLSVGAAGGGLLTRNSDAWVGWRHSRDVADGQDAYLRSEAAGRSLTTARLLGFGRCGFVTDEELFTEEEYRNDPFVTGWAAPHGMHHGAAAAIQVPTGDLIVVQVQRRAGKPAFGPADLARLDAFRPHLARAGLLSARWRLERQRAAVEALALIGLPAAAVTADCKVLAANSLITAASAPVVWRAGDRIAFADSASTALMRDALATPVPSARPTVRSLPVRTGEDDHSAVAHLIPMTGSAIDLFGPAVSLLVITPVAAPAPDAALIQGLFDLTAAEAAVARGLAEGLGIDAIAARQGVARETVRTQLKSVMAKTGKRRQSEIAALIAGLPRTPRA